jgi:hypothetical protein
MFKKKRAIKILEKELESITYPNPVILTSLRNTIKKYFGETSIEYKNILRINQKQDIAIFIEGCIQSIKNNGITNEQKNFLFSISNTWLGILIPIIIGGIFSIGLFFGQQQKNIDDIKLEQDYDKLFKEYNRLKDSLISSSNHNTQNISKEEHQHRNPIDTNTTNHR